MATLLIVDDEQSIRDMLTDVLSENGYEACGAKDGKAALELLKQRQVHLILLDILLPHTNGFELVKILDADPKFNTIPIVAFSGVYRSLSHRKELTSYNQVIDFLDKPINTDSLLNLISQTLQHQPHEKTEITGCRNLTASLNSPPEQSESAADSTSDEPTGESELISIDTQYERQHVEQVTEASFKRNRVFLQGEFTNTSLAEVLGMLWSNKATGALLLRKQRAKKIIHLKDGNPFNVKSNLVHECLGQLLVREGIITREQCEQSILQMRESGQKQGRILIEMRSIAENYLSYALELQFEKKLFDVFHWQSGEYRFNPDGTLPQPNTSIKSTGADIIVEGIKRCFDDNRLQLRMAKFLDSKLSKSQDTFDWDKLDLGSEQSSVLQKIQFPTTVAQILQAHHLETQVTYRLLYTLLSLRLLRADS